MATIKLGDMLKENIRSRYLLTDDKGPYGYADRTAPKQLMEDTETGGTYLSPNLASIFGGDAISTKDFISILGVTKKEMTETLKAVRAKQISLVSIGYGGISINLIHFLSLFAHYCNVPNLFKQLIIYEEDDITLMNILRVYKDTTKIPCDVEIQNKLQGFTEYNLAPKDEVHLIDYRLDTEILGEIKKHAAKKENLDKNIIYFGACDFETRKELETLPFYFTGHGGNEVSIIVRPVVDSELTMETYGTIDLNVFFLNVLRLSYQFLIELANDTQSKVPNDTVIWEYTDTKETDA